MNNERPDPTLLLRSYEEELRIAGFKVDCMVGELTGEPLKPESDYIGIVATVA